MVSIHESWSRLLQLKYKNDDIKSICHLNLLYSWMKSGLVWKIGTFLLGVVHKWRHANSGDIWLPPPPPSHTASQFVPLKLYGPVKLCHTVEDPPSRVTSFMDNALGLWTFTPAECPMTSIDFLDYSIVPNAFKHQKLAQKNYSTTLAYV